LREGSIAYLFSKYVTSEDMVKKGIHPAWGAITLPQLPSTCVVHDLNHLEQISGVMAVQYKKAVGPWIEYLRILRA
jgi:hypothetical protein